MIQKILAKKKKKKKKRGDFKNFNWFQFYIYKLRMILCIGIAP